MRVGAGTALTRSVHSYLGSGSGGSGVPTGTVASRPLLLPSSPNSVRISTDRVFIDGPATIPPRPVRWRRNSNRSIANFSGHQRHPVEQLHALHRIAAVFLEAADVLALRVMRFLRGRVFLVLDEDEAARIILLLEQLVS